MASDAGVTYVSHCHWLVGIEERYIIASQVRRCLDCNWTRLPSKYTLYLSTIHVNSLLLSGKIRSSLLFFGLLQL